MSSPYRIWRIGTGARLSGTAAVHGNKNAALPAMAAALLLPVGTRLELTHVPRIIDVAILTEILAVYGVSAVWSGPSSLSLSRSGYPSAAPEVPASLAARIRGSVILLGALATQYASFRLAKPGGDKIGGRPIGAHLTALEDLGFAITDEGDSLSVSRTSGDIRGGTVVLTEQSVTATSLLLLYSAGLGPDRHLTIMNAACEPHIVTLCSLLSSMGAVIEGRLSNLLTVRWPRGVLEPTSAFRLDDDFMEAATYAVAAAVTKSDIIIPFMNAGVYLHLMDRYLDWMGVRTKLLSHEWRILGASSEMRISPSLHSVKAEPWPRFPTDVMSLFIVLATQCAGSLKFVEYMYDDRFGFVQTLRDIGARIDLFPPHAVRVHGPTPLRGDEFFLRPDIRSGASMLLAALAAGGDTILHDRGAVIDRGYENLPHSLALLGAPIEELRSPFS